MASELGDSVPTILVIDDEPSNLQLIKMAVQREGFECRLVCLESAREGMDYLSRNRVDLVVLDVMMPEMDGFEMFERIKQDPKLNDIPVMFLSAMQEPRYVIQGLEAGAVDYIGKPIIAQVLTARFRSVLRTRALQRELKVRNAELEDADRLKNEFLSFCSHDLRAPMSAIELTCQMLADVVPGETPGEALELIDRIVNQTRLARRLVENLLDANKLEEGQLSPEPTFFSPEALVAACVQDQEPMLVVRGLELATDLDLGDTIVFGDREMLSQTVRNLLGNAIKFASGRIRVESRIESREPEEGGFWVLDVVNDGPPIAEADLPHIFAKYSQGHYSGVGHGLGLYIARQTVELHDGSIGVAANRPGETRFSFRLPLAFGRDAVPDLSGACDARVRVLTTSRRRAELLENVLLEGGLVHVNATPAPDGLESALPAERPDVVVFDLEHPPGETVRLSELMAGTGERTAWILLGAPESVGSVIRLAGGRRATLPHPFDPVAYLRQVARFLEPGHPAVAHSG